MIGIFTWKRSVQKPTINDNSIMEVGVLVFRMIIKTHPIIYKIWEFIKQGYSFIKNTD